MYSLVPILGLGPTGLPPSQRVDRAKADAQEGLAAATKMLHALRDDAAAASAAERVVQRACPC